MSDVIANKLDSLEEWRQNNLKRLDILHAWLRDNNLESKEVNSILLGIRSRLQSNELKIAFVGDFSRGKSELINAIFFASGKRRIMPVSAGRTTMCAVEIGYNKNYPPCIRLLPLMTRLQDMPLLEWVSDKYDDIWITEELNIDDPELLATMIGRVSERRLVSPAEAADLGLWDMDNLEKNPPTNALGLLEVPKWRYAIVNYPHPLLKRGISILDTPGLNALGSELELTLDLLPQAHAIMYVLQADTGVTRTDMQIWKDYLSKAHTADRPCYILLNKIDTLWDDLLSPEEVTAQLEQQRQTCAAMLNIPLAKVFTVSANKALIGKVNNDRALLEKSQILNVERMLVGEMLPRREQILQQTLGAGLGELYTLITGQFGSHIQTLDGQIEELQAFRGKNEEAAHQIFDRLRKRDRALSRLRKTASEMRVLESRALRRMSKFIGHEALDTELVELSVGIHDPGMKVSLTKTFEKVMHLLRVRAKKFENMVHEFEALVNSHAEKLESEYGVNFSGLPSPGVGSLMTDLDLLEDRHEVFFGANQMIRLRRAQQTSRVYHTLLTRIRSIFDEAFDMLDMWSKGSYNALVNKVGDLEKSTALLYENIKRVQMAKEPLEDRIDIMEAERLELFQQQSELAKMMQEFEQFSPAWLKVGISKESSKRQLVREQVRLEEAASAEKEEQMDGNLEEEDSQDTMQSARPDAAEDDEVWSDEKEDISSESFESEWDESEGPTTMSMAYAPTENSMSATEDADNSEDEGENFDDIQSNDVDNEEPPQHLSSDTK